MLIEKGDILVTKVEMEDLTKYKKYEVLFANIDDLYINDDKGIKWWFGQIGCLKPWDKFFYTEKEWNRITRLNKLLS
jgi:hypothetical protein